MSIQKCPRYLKDTDVKTKGDNSMHPFVHAPPEIIAVILKQLESEALSVRFDTLKSLRLTSRIFRGILSLVPHDWWDEMSSISYDHAIANSLLTPASLRQAWPGELCSRSLEFSIGGEMNDTNFEINAQSQEIVDVCHVVRNEVRAPLMVDVHVYPNGKKKQKGCTFGKCLEKIADAVYKIKLSGIDGSHDFGVVVDQVFPNAALATFHGTSVSNFHKVFPRVLKCDIEVASFDKEVSDALVRWPLPAVVRPNMHLVLAGAEVVDVPSAGIEAHEIRFEETKSLELQSSSAKIKANRIIFKDMPIPSVNATSPVISTPELVVDGSRFSQAFIAQLSNVVQISAVSTLDLRNVHFVTSSVFARLPDTVDDLSIIMCTSDDPMCFDALKPSIRCLNLKWDGSRTNSACIDLSVPGVAGENCEKLRIETENAVASFRVCLTGTKKLTLFYAEGFRRGLQLEMPSDLPLSVFGIGPRTHLRIGTVSLRGITKFPLTRVIVETAQNVGEVATFISTCAEDITKVETLISSDAFAALLPTIITASTPHIANWLRYSVAKTIPPRAKNLLGVVLACINRHQVAQENVNRVDSDFLRIFAFLYPRSFQETYRSETIAVHPADTWICSRPEQFNGAPPVKSRKNVRGISLTTGAGTMLEICPTDSFVPLYRLPNGAQVFSRIVKLAYDTPKNTTIEDSVEALHMKHEITHGTSVLLLRILRTTTPDAMDVHSQLPITEYVSSLTRPVIIARAKSLPSVEALEETARGDIKLAKSPEDVTRLVKRYAGFGPGFLNLVIVTAAQPANSELLRKLKLVPTRASAVRTRTVAVTDFDLAETVVKERIMGNMCGIARWVVMQNVKKGASSDAIMTAYCSALHCFSNMGPS